MIVLSRVDDKLVHGQVATAWVKVAGANRIYVVDDETAKDVFLCKLYKGVAPAGTKVEVWDLETACTKVKLVGEHEKIKGLILAKSPKEFLAMARAGIHFPKLIIGNMAPKEGRVQLHPGLNTFADAEERDALRKLGELGVDVKLHMIPDNPGIPILKAKGMKESL